MIAGSGLAFCYQKSRPDPLRVFATVDTVYEQVGLVTDGRGVTHIGAE